jgi:uncharacterized membrane protein
MILSSRTTVVAPSGIAYFGLSVHLCTYNVVVVVVGGGGGVGVCVFVVFVFVVVQFSLTCNTQVSTSWRSTESQIALLP